MFELFIFVIISISFAFFQVIYFSILFSNDLFFFDYLFLIIFFLSFLFFLFTYSLIVYYCFFWFIYSFFISDEFLCFVFVLNFWTYFRSSPLEMFLGKDVLKICSKFTGKDPCWSVISIKLQNNQAENHWEKLW